MSQSRWATLIEWLESHGMGPPLVGVKAMQGAGYGLIALQTCQPSTPLFKIPAAAMLNFRTLRHIYNHSLTAVQMISLHLAKFRPTENGESLDPLFGPYISILPRDFDFHPVTWAVRHKHACSSSSEDALLQMLPPTTKTGLDELVARFEADWDSVCEYLQPVELDPLMDYLWAWLNVNTRCIYHRVGATRSDPNNLTLCPILDFANHTSSGPHMMPEASSAEIWNTAPTKALGDSFTLLSPSDGTVKESSELCLTYGAHSNRKLFLEYGFVDGSATRQRYGEVDVRDLVEGLFDKESESILRDAGYWGEWTLDSATNDSRPSFRLVTALRLHSLLTSEPLGKKDESLLLWRGTLEGRCYIVSELNEECWRRQLRDVCNQVIQRAQLMLLKIGERVDWPEYIHSIRELWVEDVFVAEAVLKRLTAGDEF